MPLLKWLTRFCLACFVVAVVSIVVLISVLSGCSWLELTESHDTRIALEPGQRMDFNMMTKKNSSGQDIEEFVCPTGILICRGSVITTTCECPL